MAAGNQAIEAGIRLATRSGFRDRLLARGQARSIIWTDGELPEDAPAFSSRLSYDLLSYGYALLSYGLRLLEGEGDTKLAREAFEHAASAIEAVIAKGTNDTTRDFHRLVAASAYHLGRFSARAYSLLRISLDEANLTEAERCLARIMIRDIDGLNAQIAAFRLRGEGSDAHLAQLLAQVDVDGVPEGEALSESVLDAVDIALTDSFMGAVGMAMLGFERGERKLLDGAVGRLRTGLEGAAGLHLVNQWWCHRLTIHLLQDLWDSSLHRRLPKIPHDSGGASDWAALRELYVAVLYRRSRAEIDLWPSQLAATERVLNLAENLVVSLPTSAGKTRIAEMCILVCLSTGKRVIFVTPLRALSAQTETILRRTFQPLGKTVSSLYGSIGVSEVDENILRDKDIIVATPEKLDFALRNEPALLNDVGLVVLDEGHMIGLGEREVRYEVQIQRLLRRSDAASRRIICLSAILPEDDKLEDFAAWLTCDSPDGIVQDDWRPTRLRFGEVEWRRDHARLKVSVGEEQPFVPRFISAKVPPKKKRVTPFPKDQRELCLATAWRLVEDGQSVLIFCPLRKSVEPFAEAIVDLHERGALASVLDCDEADLRAAIAIGSEWFGADHPILKCLKLGVAVHHGALPTPYRKEVERLLRDGVLKITVSSPTLAQGLNLSATSLVFHAITRKGEPIETSEFRNVIGRAGRAYIDVEGLVLYPMFDDQRKRRTKWEALIADQSGKEMESGLIRLLIALLRRMQAKLRSRSKELPNLIAYVMNNAAWEFEPLPSETPTETAAEASRWNAFLTTLDTAILGMLGESDVADDEIEAKLDAVLESSLWSRRLLRRNEAVRAVLKQGLVARAKYIWSHTTAVQRRGYFLSGVGLNTGRQLDVQAGQLAHLLVCANGAILNDDDELAVRMITEFAEIIFTIDPFAPADLPANWKMVLAAWLKGESIAPVAGKHEGSILKFIEDGLIYRLAWGMEAARVRALAHGDKINDQFTISDYELGTAVAAIETGSLNRSAAVLMRAGFSSRAGAIKAVKEGGGEFVTMRELRAWVTSERVVRLSEDAEWPTAETNELWVDFVRSLRPAARQTWRRKSTITSVKWARGEAPASGTPLRIFDVQGTSLVLTADYERLGSLKAPLDPRRTGLLRATVTEAEDEIELEYIGPDDLYAA